MFKRLNQRAKNYLILQAIGMSMGTFTHIQWILKNGFLSEKYNASIWSTIFWDSLTLLDPLAAILLVVKPKSGLYLTLLIILADVIHNNIFYWQELYLNPPQPLEWIKQYWMILGQIIFALFVCLTFKYNVNKVDELS